MHCDYFNVRHWFKISCLKVLSFPVIMGLERKLVQIDNFSHEDKIIIKIKGI